MSFLMFFWSWKNEQLARFHSSFVFEFVVSWEWFVGVVGISQNE